jgi:DNA-binding NarL/FixJ family response regulator
MQNVLVEMAELARQISAQIDTRSSKLEVLMKEADERIAHLQSLSRGQPTGLTSNSLPDSTEAQQADASALDPRNVQVYALADQGRTPLEIAQQLNRPSGEIELILALRG